MSHRSLAHLTSVEVPKTNPYLIKHMQHTEIKGHPLLISYNTCLPVSTAGEPSWVNLFATNVCMILFISIDISTANAEVNVTVTFLLLKAL